jgi:hypothetical protein
MTLLDEQDNYAPTIAMLAQKRRRAMTHVPIPLRGTDCGEAAALSATVTNPVRLPVLVGVNCTVIVHRCPAAKLRVPTQSLV